MWKFLAGGLMGAALSARHRIQSNPSLSVEAPVLDVIMDPSKDVQPVRAVIVGGGMSGGRLASQLDSMLSVTLIDEKNFFELSNDIIPVLSNKWEAEKHDEACRRMMVLHRYYLKRTNVLTGTVDGVDESVVYLKDGRRIPYDVLFVATGERKAFPFQTQQRTISGRVSELRHFNKFLQDCRKVAVVGGGPVGTSLAHDLASARADLEVHLFHSKAELLPGLPGVCRRYALDKLEKNPNLHIHLCRRVTNVEGFDANGQVVVAEEKSTSWWPQWLVPPRSVPAPHRYRVHYDMLHYERQPQQSIISQIYFGKRSDMIDGGEVEGTATEDDFDYVFPVMGDTPRPIVAGSSKRPNLLKEHELPDGHYRVSTLMQLFARPNIFAVGRCTNLPVTRCYGSSDIESRIVFRAINSIVNNPTKSFLGSQDGVQLARMKVPRLHVRLGNDDAVGCTPWSGGMTGFSAVHEFMQDRAYLIKEFQRPVFYKQQDQMKVQQRLSRWLAEEITDPVDFSHC